MRIFAASLATETNTFSPLPVGLAAFENGMLYQGGTHPEAPSFFAGPLFAARQAARKNGWTLIEGLVAAAWPAGLVTREAYEALREQILSEIRAALPLEMVVLGLHGAMVADGYDDCEGDLLERVRALVGPDTAVGATLDPHAHMTGQMVRAADLLICWKEYPHTDIVERAVELVDLLAARVQGRCRPVPALVDCEMISLIFTTQEPGRTLVAREYALEKLPGVLSVSLVHGFPWADVPGMGTKVLVYADNDASLAQQSARTFADDVIAARDALRADEPDIDAALDRALASAATPVAIADGADNAGGGAASDSTFFLRRLIERDVGQAALGPLWDPAVVDMAFNAGVDARLRVRLGGKTGPMSGEPLDAEVTVRALKRGHTMAGLAEGERVNCGDSALIGVNGVDVVVTSRRVQAIGTDLFTDLGCALEAKRMIVVKSSQHFHAHYSKVVGKVIYASAPGTVTSDLDSLGHRRIRRPKWPLGDLA
ncbi:M81 family metallopeptidase [Paraburkholderia antibiotica]|uniref:Microcystinase C n=1 Tax=Paraburkholderia antibiotica TaxID=2728839 RepID=A0A7X9X330_9BURK|nr:M81 family metallopeptidase [Paraburkholderia antibiotica]NML30525.1 M81 family metallopeptidase [Paraburkholderia antibiotica]